MPRANVMALCACALIAVFTSRAHAQTVPAWMKVPAAFVLSSELHGQLNATSAARAPKDTRRSVYRIATGTGLITAGVIHAATFGLQQLCYEPDTRVPTAIPSGTLVAVSGLALVVHGVLKLRRLPREYRHMKANDGEVPILSALAALGTTTVASAVLAGFAAPWFEGCVSS